MLKERGEKNAESWEASIVNTSLHQKISPLITSRKQALRPTLGIVVFMYEGAAPPAWEGNGQSHLNFRLLHQQGSVIGALLHAGYNYTTTRCETGYGELAMSYGLDDLPSFGLAWRFLQLENIQFTSFHLVEFPNNLFLLHWSITIKISPPENGIRSNFIS
jgi:hypothetical protein